MIFFSSSFLTRILKFWKGVIQFYYTSFHSEKDLGEPVSILEEKVLFVNWNSWSLSRLLILRLPPIRPFDFFFLLIEFQLVFLPAVLNRGYSLFCRPIQCSILSERRVQRPYGLGGGGPGKVGHNLWIKQLRTEDGDQPTESESGFQDEHRIISLGGKQTVKMGAHDRIMVITPGGGGWGTVGDGSAGLLEVDSKTMQGHLRGSLKDRRDAAEGA